MIWRNRGRRSSILAPNPAIVAVDCTPVPLKVRTESDKFIFLNHFELHNVFRGSGAVDMSAHSHSGHRSGRTRYRYHKRYAPTTVHFVPSILDRRLTASGGQIRIHPMSETRPEIRV